MRAATSPSVSSIYRNLPILDACGVLRPSPSVGDDAVRYELHETLTRHHHHLDCSACGELVDFILPDEIEHALALAAEEARQRAGFVTESQRLEPTGICSGCA